MEVLLMHKRRKRWIAAFGLFCLSSSERIYGSQVQLLDLHALRNKKQNDNEGASIKSRRNSKFIHLSQGQQTHGLNILCLPQEVGCSVPLLQEELLRKYREVLLQNL